jgi:hypothetical protein
MSTLSRRSHGGRIALAGAITGALALGALAGPAMAATDGTSHVGAMRKSGGKPPEFVVIRKAGGDGNPYIIAI